MKQNNVDSIDKCMRLLDKHDEPIFNKYLVMLILDEDDAHALLDDLHIAECEGYGCNAGTEIVEQLEEQNLERRM